MKDKLTYTGKKSNYYKTKTFLLGTLGALIGISSLAIPVAFSYIHEQENSTQISAKKAEVKADEEENVIISSEELPLISESF